MAFIYYIIIYKLFIHDLKSINIVILKLDYCCGKVKNFMGGHVRYVIFCGLGDYVGMLSNFH